MRFFRSTVASCRIGIRLVYAVLALALAVANGKAATLLEDGQDYAASTSTPIAGRPPWSLSGYTNSTTSFVKIVAGDLSGATNPDIAPLTNRVNSAAILQVGRASSSGKWYFRSLSNNVSSGSVYFSFLLKVTVNPTTADEFMGTMIAGGLSNAPVATDPLSLHARAGADASHYNLGIQRLKGTTQWGAASLAAKTTYLIVLKYDFGSSSACSLYINPIPGNDEPTSPDASATSDGVTAEPENIGTVLFYESFVAPVTSGTFQYDVMRADNDWYTVTPPSTNAQFGSSPCYRTVEETYATLAQIATNYPKIARLVDIGNSWDKDNSGGAAGYDLLALVLSNTNRPGPKPKFFLVGEHHAREMTTAETATRFAEELVTAYGVDPDVTWILDYFEVHILPMANPDGRKIAEQGISWRKNTDTNNFCGTTYGVDLNRNCGFKWGLPGASIDPCNVEYRGLAAFSEPENQAIRDYILSLYADQRGPADTDAAPINATGLVLTLHSYADKVLYPWGWTNTPAPNSTALQTLGGKLSYFNHYTVESGYSYNVSSGGLIDWVYGELGVSAYTIEMGIAFFEPCTTFETATYPSNRLALNYAAKACRQPYLSPAGPDVLQATVSSQTNVPGATINLSAIAVSGRSYGYAPLPTAANITGVRYSVDDPSWITGVVMHSMTATDGSFNSPNEAVVAAIDTTGWSPGRHILFIEAQTGSGSWGVPTAAFVFIQPLLLSASIEATNIVLRWPSTTNILYTLLQSSDLLSPFSVLASNIEATPPTNTFTDAVSTNGSRYFRLRFQF